MKHLLLRGAIVGIALAIVVFAGAASPSGHARGISYSSLNPIQQRLVSGALLQSLGPAATTSPSKRPTARAAVSGCVNPTGGGDESDEADNECAPDNYAAPTGGGGGGSGDPNYTASGQGDCSENRGDNVKVNQNCENIADPALAGRSQAQNEEAIAIDPMHPDHMVASQNDYRRGDGNCYGAYSLDGGHHWSDTTIPMSFTYGGTTWGTARQYWQAGGDTSVAWDTKGNAYFSCQVFNRGAAVSPNPDQSSAFYVFRSTGNGGASWNFPGRPVVEQNDSTGSVLLDKNYLTVDNHVGSPFQDRVYETWTTFAADGTAYIYEAHSSNYGESFSSPVLVSSDSPLCPFTYAGFGIGTPHGKCNENQFSNPFTGPDGALYVTWANYNSASSDPFGTGNNSYQVLIAKSTDGGVTFSAAVKVSAFYDLPDCVAYQNSDPGRACVPEKGPSTNSVFRATNYPVGDVNPKSPNQVVVSFGSYINKDSKESNGCTPTGFSPFGQPLYTGAKTAGACNNDILISVSTNGGGTFTGTSADPRTETTVNPDSDQAKSDQFWQWQAFNKNGKLAIDYYDRQYGHSTGSPAVPSDEYTGSSDITLSGSNDLVNWSTTRVTSSSMPPPTQFAGQFYGDYIGMDAFDKAVPIWADSRDPELFICPGSGAPQVCTGTYTTPQGPIQANDENSYMSIVDIPSAGNGHDH